MSCLNSYKDIPLSEGQYFATAEASECYLITDVDGISKADPTQIVPIGIDQSVSTPYSGGGILNTNRYTKIESSLFNFNDDNLSDPVTEINIHSLPIRFAVVYVDPDNANKEHRYYYNYCCDVDARVDCPDIQKNDYDYNNEEYEYSGTILESDAIPGFTTQGITKWHTDDDEIYDSETSLCGNQGDLRLTPYTEPALRVNYDQEEVDPNLIDVQSPQQ